MDEPVGDYLSMADVIRRLSLPLKSNEDPVVIEVRRSHILKDSLKEAKKAKFDASKMLKVHVFLQYQHFFNYCYNNRSDLSVRELWIKVDLGVNFFVY